VIKYEHLLGREFVLGKSDCYSIVRDFYRDNYGIELPNYARPTNFWEVGMDMYMERFRKNNFEVLHVHPAELVTGDVFLMSIHASVVNHAGVLVGRGQMLHHVVRQMSTVTPYAGLWRNNTMAIVRHREVKSLQPKSQADILDLVPNHIRRKLDAHLRENPAATA
jgi:cell wall-associated NlpC family hydrolase